MCYVVKSEDVRDRELNVSRGKVRLCGTDRELNVRYGKVRLRGGGN